MIVLKRGGALTLVNVVDLETYLRGVVPWEIGRPGEKGLAALEAQAVAARTYTVAHLAERQEHGCDVWADTRDQVYRGLEGVDSWCDEAIASTAGLVLRHRGEEIEAYYSSTCGGVSSNVHEVWQRGERSYLRSHSDTGRDGRAFCSGSSQFTWEERWTRAELEAVLAKSLPAYLDWVAASPARRAWAGKVFEPSAGSADGGAPGRLRSLRIRSRTTSGRVGVLEVSTTAGVYRVRGDRSRWVLAPASGRFSILRSAWFDLAMERDRDGRLVGVRAEGRGFGHGVGLCQVGALRMAELGYGVREILEHYYPGAKLETAWR
jgi:stage II sporulation protein D